MTTGDWIALAGVAVGLLGIVAGGFVALSHRIDAQDVRIAAIAARVMNGLRNGGHE